MNSKKAAAKSSAKARTGIEGFDQITHGGLPRGRTSLLGGGPGSGKTLMSLQTLVNAACHDNEPGIFVAFEESSEQVIANASQFGWDMEGLQKKNLFFLDAQPNPDLLRAGSFDLSGMLAALGAKASEMKARRIVFDAIDVLLALLGDKAAERRELYRLNDWILKLGLTAIITCKSGDGIHQMDFGSHLGFIQFMVDCAVMLNHDVVQGVSQRSLRVTKYRGSSFSENESPFLIGSAGLEVAGIREMDHVSGPVTTDRVSSGVARLDAMLDGGYFRGASVLITGFPGTAKSTLSGAFAEAACLRGERTMFISFDSDANEVVRNLASVNIRLERFIKKDLLRLVSARAVTGSAEIHLMQIKSIARAHRARCVVIDPISALSQTGNEMVAHTVAGRLIDWAKFDGITLVCTSLLDGDTGTASMQTEGTPLQISTIADTWIHLNYLVHAGERNRGLSIVKSRGTAHSNQVRELVLSHEGVTLADPYTAGGEVLMGTLRWEKERAVHTAMEEAVVSEKQRKATLDAEEAELKARLKSIELALNMKIAEKLSLARAAAFRAKESTRDETSLRALRGVDTK